MRSLVTRHSPLTTFFAPRLQFHFDSQWLKPFGKISEVLFRQNFCWRHQRDVEAAFNRHQRAARRDRRFSRANIALQQSPHRVRAAHVRANFFQDIRLRRRELETELCEERFHQTIVTTARQRL